MARTGREEPSLRIVVDTNVFISALISPVGPCAQIVELGRTDVLEIVVSLDLKAELERVTSRSKFQRHQRYSVRLPLFLAIVARLRIIPLATPLPRVVEFDPDDDVVVATALAGNADFIVSGDRHLLSLGDYQGIPVVAPSAFLAMHGF